MKNLIPITLATTLVASGISSAQTPAYSKPSGYVTELFKAGQFNLFGITLQTPSITGGILTTIGASSVADTSKDFTALLVPGKTYVLEIDDATSSATGAIAEVTSWSGSSLNTSPTNLTLLGATNGTKYSLREASTIAQIFGASNEFGLSPGTLATADILWVSNGSGSFSRYYFATAQPPFVTAGWKLIGGGNVDRSATPLVYTDGLILQRRGTTDLSLVVTGQVKTTPTVIAVSGNAFNHIGTTFPVGSTLASSGLQATVQAGGLNTSDIVWVPDGTSGYKRYYLATAQPPFVTAGWKLIGGGNTDRGTEAIRSGIILQRKGPSTNLKIVPPASYSTL